MKNLYYHLFDVTRKWEDPDHSLFGHQSINSDIAGLVTSFAEHNGVSPSDIRLFIMPTKQQYEMQYQEWVKNIKW